GEGAVVPREPRQPVHRQPGGRGGGRGALRPRLARLRGEVRAVLDLFRERRAPRPSRPVRALHVPAGGAMNPAGPRRSAYAALSAVIVILDQATKMLVDRLMTLHESRLLVDGVLRLTYVQNRGAAFGILSDADLPYQSVLFAVVSLAALGAIAAYAWKLPARSRLPQTALALIMGG